MLQGQRELADQVGSNSLWARARPPTLGRFGRGCCSLVLPSFRLIRYFVFSKSSLATVTAVVAFGQPEAPLGCGLSPYRGRCGDKAPRLRRKKN
jgi:hypothetical protein